MTHKYLQLKQKALEITYHLSGFIKNDGKPELVMKLKNELNTTINEMMEIKKNENEN